MGECPRSFLGLGQAPCPSSARTAAGTGTPKLPGQRRPSLSCARGLRGWGSVILGPPRSVPVPAVPLNPCLSPPVPNIPPISDIPSIPAVPSGPRCSPPGRSGARALAAPPLAQRGRSAPAPRCAAPHVLTAPPLARRAPHATNQRPPGAHLAQWPLGGGPPAAEGGVRLAESA